jgi:hypothetical protein
VSPERGLFAERGARPRSRRDEAPSPSSAGSPPPADSVAAPAVRAEAPPEAADVLRDVRQGVRSTVDEWLSERSHTVSLAVTQVVEDALTRLQAAHAAQVRELTARYEERLSAAEAERSDLVRGALRRRRARVRAVEKDLRERIERLERSLTEASLEAVERLREVERREADKRAELERSMHQALRDKDDEIARLRRGGGADERFETLADQLRSRRPLN